MSQEQNQVFEKIFNNIKFQDDYMLTRKDLLKEKMGLEAQIKSLESRVETITRTLNGWDLTLIYKEN
jgi:hypothetical protein